MAKGISVDLIVDPKKAIAGIGQVESVATRATRTLGRIGLVAGGALLGLATVAAVGAGVLTTSVVKAYSEYEQLAGGVTKLFGDADQTVAKFAQNAATSAGLSTNAYLATVTSFSASLISGLHGDQEAAARSADQAITDMADNANTFGTSIDSLQLAYQGFAKGNFALLDNLKLGFGGSQQGMADLINTSGVLGSSMKVTAQNVKDVPFDKMIEAIHVVQTQMGIAGTTAKEAAGTIAGSFEATKASLQNLITGLGTADSDFDSLVGNLASNAQNLANNIGPVVERLADAVPAIVPALVSAFEKVVPALVPLAANLVTSILDGVVKAAPMLIKGATPVVLNLVTGIVKMLPAILSTGIKVLVTLIQGVSAALPQLIPVAVSAVLGLVNALISNAPLLLSAALELIVGLGKGLIAALPQLIAALPAIITGIVTYLVGAIPTLINAGLDLFLALVDALPEIILGIVAAIPQIIFGIQKAVISSIPQLIKAGIELFIALVSATPTIISEIIKAIPQIVTGIFNAFTDPKMVGQLAKAGGQLIMGLWNGIKDLGAWLWSKVSGFFGGLVNNIKSFFGIHSPSTLFADFGGFMVKGLEKGLSGPNHLDGITTKLSRQVADGFQGSLGTIAATAKATVQTSGGVLGGGGSVTLDVHLPVGMPAAEAGRGIVNALQEYVRTGGTGLRAVLG